MNENKEKDESFLLLGDWYANDLKKKEIDKFERAAILRRMIDELGISERQFAERYSIKPNTLQDYLLYNLISKEEYDRMIANGFTVTAIYRYIRNNREKPVINPHTEINVWAEETIRKAKHYKNSKELVVGKDTEELLDKASNEINSLIVDIRLKVKKQSKKVLPSK